ncbi:MAG: glycosyltransferase [Beggiatoa sp. IS2]|nr:MAG: glycosyltransferase [Beggiatoa sp. IS2]
MTHISIVTPVYKAESCLHELYRRLKISLETITPDFEIIMVEDCGGDNSWEIIQQLAQQDVRVKGIQFSRNFGQHYGITAGLDHCTGKWIVVMDCDLQDRPEEIIRLYQKAQEGCDIVLAKRVERQDSFWKKFASYLYYKVLEHLTEGRQDHTVANFGIYSYQVIEKFRQFKERSRLFPLIIRMLGFNSVTLEVEHAGRFAGKSTYSFYKQIKLAVDGIISQSNKLLTYSIRIGFLLSLGAFTYAIYLIVRYFLLGIPVEGWTSMMVSIYFLAGLLFVNLGIIGLYLGKIFDETKNRPLYVIKETIGFHGQQ